jgi:hypothetical protein
MPSALQDIDEVCRLLWSIQTGSYRADLPNPWGDLFHHRCLPYHLLRLARSMMHILASPDMLVHHHLVWILVIKAAFALLHPPLPQFMPPCLQPAQTCLSWSSCNHLCSGSVPDTHLRCIYLFARELYAGSSFSYSSFLQVPLVQRPSTCPQYVREE